MTSYVIVKDTGWTIEAFLPENDTEAADGWQVIAIRGKVKKEFRVPMVHSPIFGPDIEDVAALEKAVDSFIKDNPYEITCSPTSPINPNDTTP